MNRWNIPDWLEQEVIERDKCCIYCGVHFVAGNESSKSKPTWEHVVNDEKIVNLDNIARCCFSCNASKGTKNLADWLQSDYCRNRGITENTIAEVARRALAAPPKSYEPPNSKSIENEMLALSPAERIDVAKLILSSLDYHEQKCIMEKVKKYRKGIKHFAISSWLQQAEDDLMVAKTVTVPSFIRCYHAQQSMEKMLKAAFVVANGTFYNNSYALNSERKKFDVKVPDYVSNCAWELNEGVMFPFTHNLIYLWNKLRKSDSKSFGPLNKEQKKFMKKVSKYAAEYRYPYFSKKSGLMVINLPDNDVQEGVDAATILCADIYKYICNRSQVSQI